MRFVALAVASFLALGCAAAAPRPAVEGVQRLAVNGAEIAYAVDGTGPPVLIIHGAWGDYRSFSRAVPVLSEKCTVVRVSLRYHWPTPWPASEQETYDRYRVETHAADLVLLIERLGRSPVDLVGHSYGGVVAALVAPARPDLVRKLVLVEPAFYSLWSSSPGGEEWVQEMAEWNKAMRARLRAGQDPLEVARSMYDEDRPGTFDSFPEWRRQIMVDNARTMGPLLANPLGGLRFACEEAKKLSMPVLVIEGQRTGPGMSAINTVLLGCLPDARRVVLPDVGHTIQFDAPEAMASTVVEFLAR